MWIFPLCTGHWDLTSPYFLITTLNNTISNFSKRNVAFFHPVAEAGRGGRGQNRLRVNSLKASVGPSYFPSLFTHQACKVDFIVLIL